MAKLPSNTRRSVRPAARAAALIRWLIAFTFCIVLLLSEFGEPRCRELVWRPASGLRLINRNLNQEDDSWQKLFLLCLLSRGGINGRGDARDPVRRKASQASMFSNRRFVGSQINAVDLIF